MKKRISLLIALTLALTIVLGIAGVSSQGATAAPVFEKLNLVDATVKADHLNVRQGASTSFPIVCVLKKGDTVKIFGKLGDWYAIYEPKKGCVGAVKSTYINTQATTSPVQPKPVPTKAPAPSSQAKTKYQAPVNPPAGISADEQTLLNLVNKARTSAGLAALEFDMPLMKVAREKAKDMVDNHYFDHNSPTYGSPFDMMRKFGVTFNSAGENIAGNQTVAAAFDRWMGSIDHKKNILGSKYNYTGIGIVKSNTYGKILVQQFIGK